MRFRIVFLIAVGMLFSQVKSGFSNDLKAEIKIIPKPYKTEYLEGTFKIDSNTAIKSETVLTEKVNQLIGYLSPATGYTFPVNINQNKGNCIELRLDKNLESLGEEGYELTVTPEKVLIKAPNPTGIFWGIQTLRQLLPKEILRDALVQNVEWVLPAVKITDKPEFKWRGLMIDYSRTFWNKSHTKKYIDALSYYKMNKLHMHLTDDQGWRLEIEKYPLLTEIASKFDTIYNEPKEREGFYSKDDIREIIQYAKDRNVEIIPEIEMPGHSAGVFAAYPEYSCSGERLSVRPFRGGEGFQQAIFCAGNEGTFEFLENILSEVAELFPSEYIHIGGDEAQKHLWKSCPKCKQAIWDNGLAYEDELHSWFIKRIEKFLSEKGKKIIGWDEMMRGGLSETATVMFWSGSRPYIPSTTVGKGNDVILSPTSYCYFDYDNTKLPVEKVYSFNPIEVYKLENTPKEHVLGVQGNFWSHIDRTEPKMDRQVFPRIIALAEVGWSTSGEKNWSNFRTRLEDHYNRLDIMDIYYTKK